MFVLLEGVSERTGELVETIFGVFNDDKYGSGDIDGEGAGGSVEAKVGSRVRGQTRRNLGFLGMELMLGRKLDHYPLYPVG